MKVHEILTEGPFDYLKGMGKEAGNQIRNIAQPFKDMHAQGQRSSLEADFSKLVMSMVQSLQQYYKLKKFITTQESPEVHEGVMDYLRGATQEVGKKVKGFAKPFQDIHKAGKLNSAKSELQELLVTIRHQESDMVRMIPKIGQNVKVLLSKVLKDNNVPQNIRLVFFNKFKGHMNVAANGQKPTPQPTRTQQPKVDDTTQQPQKGPERRQYSGAGVQSRAENVKIRGFF